MRSSVLLGFCGLCAAAVAVPAAAQQPAPAPAAAQKPAAPPAPVTVAPETGPFSLEQATAGLKGKGPLQATLEIQQKSKPFATLRCDLFDEKAPLAVANFVGLARGVRPFKDPKSGQWVKRPLYEGMTIHRVIPDYILQAGDPQCQNDTNCAGKGGFGDPGYAFPDELDNGLRPTQGGALAMANRGPNTNGSQFFITERETPFLLGQQTLFGQCGDLGDIKKIVAVERGPRDTPKEPIVIKKVTISRKARP